jgi:hypothetical protein
MTRVLTPLPALPANVFTDRANEYLQLAWQSAGQSLAAMGALRGNRLRQSGGPRSGTTSDQDQDLLRAMLVFASAGLDASMKALVQDALPTLADRHPAVQERLEEFASRRMTELNAVSPRVLGRLLAHQTSPRAALITEFVSELTGGSLQSVEELHRIRSALGIADDTPAARAIIGLRDAFSARNQIIHEMDLTDPTVQRKRRHRGIEATAKMADAVLEVGCLIVAETAAALEA